MWATANNHMYRMCIYSAHSLYFYIKASESSEVSGECEINQNFTCALQFPTLFSPISTGWSKKKFMM